MFGPGFSHLNSPEGWVIRNGDTFQIIPNVINDQGNWWNVPRPTDSLRITLDRNGERVFDGSDFALVDVAPGRASYRLGVDIARNGDTTLSTAVSCVWTFDSDTVGGDHAVPLPMSAVRFLPHVDGLNTAPAGALWSVPFEVQRQPDSAAGTVQTLTVDVSYDDGTTWKSVPVFRIGQNGTALLNHPADPATCPCGPRRPTAPETR